MKLLLDECLPRKLKSLFSQSGHLCITVREAGFGSKENGELLALAEGNFDQWATSAGCAGIREEKTVLRQGGSVPGEITLSPQDRSF
jgi:hypothetical protein